MRCLLVVITLVLSASGILARIDVTPTGIRTPVWVKICGENFTEINRLAKEVETVIHQAPSTSNVNTERPGDTVFLEIALNSRHISYFGISIEHVRDTIAAALGAGNITEIAEGDEANRIVLRFPRDMNSEFVTSMLIPLPNGASVSLSALAAFIVTQSPIIIPGEAGQSCALMFLDAPESDLDGYIGRAREAVTAGVNFPAGYSAIWIDQVKKRER